MTIKDYPLKTSRSEPAFPVLDYEASEIRFDPKKGMVNLTDMWHAVAAPAYKEPRQWARLPLTVELVEVLSLNAARSRVLVSRSGKAGDSWAAGALAVAYAKYLSPALYAWANIALLDRLKDQGDPTLEIARARSRARVAYRAQGRDDRWIMARIDGIEWRQKFIGVLRSHGIQDAEGYADCTDEIYRGSLGRSAQELKAAREVTKNTPLRDQLSTMELAKVSFSEALAADGIAATDLHGLPECERACRAAGESARIAADIFNRQLDLAG